MTRRAVAQTLRAAAPEERAEFLRVWSEANAKLNPSPAVIHLRWIRWVVKSLKAWNAAGRDFPTEKSMYVALYVLRTHEENRPLRTEECEQLRRASRAIWNATVPRSERV